MKALYSLEQIPPNLPFCHSDALSKTSPFLLLLRPNQIQPLPNSISIQNSRKPTSTFSSGSFTRASMAESDSAQSTVTHTEETKPFSVLFVCLGNICRSPAAEGVFTDLVKKRGLDSSFKIDSAGTINYHEVCSDPVWFLGK